MRAFSIFIAALVCISLAASQESQKKVSKEASITGEVIDVACYMSGGARGPDHVECAKACAKAGGSLGILTADGKVYVSLLPDDHKHNPNYLLITHVGETVEARGFVRSKGGVNGIMVRSVAMMENKK